MMYYYVESELSIHDLEVIFGRDRVRVKYQEANDEWEIRVPEFGWDSDFGKLMKESGIARYTLVCKMLK